MKWQSKWEVQDQLCIHTCIRPVSTLCTSTSSSSTFLVCKFLELGVQFITSYLLTYPQLCLANWEPSRSVPHLCRLQGSCGSSSALQWTHSISLPAHMQQSNIDPKLARVLLITADIMYHPKMLLLKQCLRNCYSQAASKFSD